jgi:pimeloyl-ACP methyl ester carboxylesterase
LTVPFRDLIPLLADRFHIVAPDLPGSGNSDLPDKANTFDQIAATIDRFTETIGFDRYAVYVFDYGAPTGFRLAVKHPDRITAIISQNGNAYEEGLSDGWNPIRAYWKDPSEANREALRGFLKPDTTVWQYTHGVPDPTRVSPDGYSLDSFYMSRPGVAEVQLDLMGDYKSNVALYPTFQQYFRTHKPPLLAAWGKNDPFFLPPGAEAFKRDIPMQRCASSTPGISRWRRMPRRSPPRFSNSFRADFASRETLAWKNQSQSSPEQARALADRQPFALRAISRRLVLSRGTGRTLRAQRKRSEPRARKRS